MVQTHTERGWHMIYTQRLNFPGLPDDMIELVYHSVFLRKNAKSFSSETWKYEFMDLLPDLENWLKENVAPLNTWSVQTLRGNIPQHKDWLHDDLKLNFLVNPGNPNSTTVWYSDNGELLHEAHFEPRTWNSLVVNINHTVTNLSMDQIRISIIQGNEKINDKIQQ